MIEFKNVCFSYGEKIILNNLSFSLSDGKNLLISGVSGSGKTTVAKLILNLITADSGTVTSPSSIATVFQEDRLIEQINVFKNICLPLKKNNFNYAEKLLAEFRLSQIKNKPVYELSGGMKRRVSIIRAIAFGGDALLLDEPFNGIDNDNIKIIADIINREYTQKGKSVIIISHNTADAKLFNADILNLCLT